MIALRVTVPIACWRKAQAREYLETELLPSPATCYGMLLALVGETDRDRHLGSRVTAGLFNQPEVSVILRTLWRIKDRKDGQGNGENSKPDYQQLVINADLLILLDSSDEIQSSTKLESRVESALVNPHVVQRFGGLSLGESTHLINDVWRLPNERLSSVVQIFIDDSSGDITLPVFVDHVGSSGTTYVVGRLVDRTSVLTRLEIPRIWHA